ncbi:MAG: hypothetical protein GC149_09455 [Gammaproteobacteria bacterium]|nr:hypothetical protein [Gammaproteobacteria bacterium]
MMRYLIPVLLLGALAGCFGGGEVVPQNHYYHLADISGETPHVEKHFGVIAVSPLQSDALHHERMILYSLQSAPLMLNTYYYHLWSNEPGQMLQEYLISYLRAAGVADTVVRYGEREHIDGQIGGYIHRFERIVGNGKPKVAVRLELSYRSRTSGTPFALTRVYDAEREAADDSMAATVKAFSAALQTIYARFVADITH